MSPLTPGEALAIAALLDCDKRLAATWREVAARLRTWASAQMTRAETPSQDTDMGAERGTLRGETEAVPAGAETPNEDLTASPRPTEPGGEWL